MKIDHVGLKVSDLRRSQAFYEASLKPLGVGVVSEVDGEVVGFASSSEKGDIQTGASSFWISPGEAPITSVHVAFEAQDRETVHAFYEAALAAGGKDNGGPGLRPHYHPNYYAAFVFDPDGHNIEAVCNH